MNEKAGSHSSRDGKRDPIRKDTDESRNYRPTNTKEEAMQSIERDLYDEAFKEWNFVPSREVGNYGPAGTLRTFNSDLGTGEYWAYFRDNLFAVNAFKMKFNKSWTMRYRCTEHLCLGCFDVVEGIAQLQGAPLAPGAITAYLGRENEEYRAQFSEGSVAVASSITISPDYYRDYLQSRFGKMDDVRAAFAKVDGRRDLPDLIDLLRKARSYRGQGVAAELFYEGVISEAIALVMEYSSRSHDKREAMSKEDSAAIDCACAYIVQNLDGDLSCTQLASELYMGQTKMKKLFKRATGLSPSSYVARERMREAERLLAETTLPVAEIGRKVGYSKAGAFTEAFRRHKGCSPQQFRKFE